MVENPYRPEVSSAVVAPRAAGVGHYENFPVASLLLPARLRPPVQAIYRFARTADDIADEGGAPDAARLAGLDALRRHLRTIESGGDPDDRIMRELANTIRAWRLPIEPFHHLLDAFAQDVIVRRYATIGELMRYCARSADPVGRLMLMLYGAAEAGNLAWSDSICSGLQIANFLQDVGVDWGKGRVYIPREDLERFGVDEGAIAAGRADAAWRGLMRFETERTRAMLEAGKPLCGRIGGRIGLELRLVVEGGLRILDRIDRVDGDVFRRRPTLGRLDWLAMAGRALIW